MDKAAQKTFFTIVTLLKILAVKYSLRYPSFLVALTLLNRIKGLISEETSRFEFNKQLEKWEQQGYKIGFLKSILSTESIPSLTQYFSEYATVIAEIEKLSNQYGPTSEKVKIEEIKQHLLDTRNRLEKIKEILRNIQRNH